MKARFLWKGRESLRSIERRARATVDPLERLRFVRSQMGGREWPVRRSPVKRAGAAIAKAMRALVSRLRK